MKKILFVISTFAIFSMLLAACGGKATPAPTQPPVVETEPPVATELPATEPPTAEPTATLVSVNLPGPSLTLREEIRWPDGSYLVWVEPGPFTMGDYFDYSPERIVTVDGFAIQNTEVTNNMYSLCVKLGECTDPDPENSPKYGDYRYLNYPITGVTWGQAVDYCTFIHGRLPTEAEWEKAARGPDGNRYPWGNENPACSLLNFKFCEAGETTNVHDYPDGVSYYGLWDMSGNVKEWVADWHNPIYEPDSPTENPVGPEIGDNRLIKSDGPTNGFDESLSAHHFWLDPLENLNDLGFRCVVEEEDLTYFAPWCELVPYLGEDVFGDDPSCNPVSDCNKVGVSQSPLCATPPEADYQPYTIVTFQMSQDPPPGWAHSVDGCVLDSSDAHNAKYLCKPGATGPAKAVGSCTVSSPCDAKCPDHYDLVGGKCIWDGSGTEGTACLPGSTYDPLNQCCTSIDGIGGDDVNLCPPGTFLLGGQCVGNPVIIPKVIQPILWDNTCRPPDQGDDDNGPGDDDTSGGDDGGGPCPPGQHEVCTPNNTAPGETCRCAPN